jgi:hypothetical protein
MAAELQTFTAAVNITKLAWETVIFLRDVKNADLLASRLYANTDRVHNLANPDEARIASNIATSLKAIKQILLKIERKFKDLKSAQASSTSATIRAKVLLILKQPAVARHESELENQIQVLQTSLGALQL